MRSETNCSLASFLAAVLLAYSAVATGDSPLADAAEKSDRRAVRKLLEEHADINASQPDGMTALHWAACRDDAELTKILIEANANVRATNHYGVTPLSLA